MFLPSPQVTYFTRDNECLPRFFGQGIAGSLLKKIIKIAKDQSLPVRLVSSAQNLDSFSLYTRQGFTPIQTFQDLYLEIPKNGLDFERSDEYLITKASLNDVETMVKLEKKLCGIERGKDFRYFIENKLEIWKTILCRDTNGELLGFLGSVDHPASQMIGLQESPKMKRLLYKCSLACLTCSRKSPVFLLPVTAKETVKTVYSLGARNCEIHFSQCYGEIPTIQGGYNADIHARNFLVSMH